MAEPTQPIPIIALHGFTGTGDDFLSLQKHCPTSWQWHCPDLPGHGSNPTQPVGKKFSLSVHLDYLEKERARICSNQPCVLLGYSMGGRIALHWALQKPAAFSALILISSSPGIESPEEQIARKKSDETLAEKIIAEGIPAFQKYWWSLPLFSGLKKLPPAEISLLETRRLQNTADGLAASLRGIGTGALPSLWNQLPSLNLPVLCMAGLRDEKFVRIAQAMNSRLPNGTTALIPDAGHMTHVEASQPVADPLQKFLQTQLRLDM
ncbi:MAG: 2-succinyl-6-hydroxy-2,4-cyclohexadiene-1-carboxylate synthase [Puniceicoccales bacterium]|jgi:2-succinyl-6-hydroxy-2,4-cyclohexadiene-1-carboxylate synthase|nr:2-succinyl-6-hydroxy-2,4-cyclohexadiene-1-carboxylate synthase [Puniceicoccales bacterium]